MLFAVGKFELDMPGHGDIYATFGDRGLSIYRDDERPRSAPFFDTWTDGGSRFAYIGKLHLIYTPANWRERRAAART